MSRRLAIGAALAVLVLLLLLAALPFTAAGSRLLLNLAGQMLPLEASYREGTLAGTLRLDAVALAIGNVDIEATDATVAIDTRCLWRSALCVDSLRAAELTVHFPGGVWHSAALEAALQYGGGRLLVQRVGTAESRLVLEGNRGEPATAPIALPEVALPLLLEVEALAMEALVLELAGRRERLLAPALRGHWTGTSLVIETLSASREGLGDLTLAGSLEMAGGWPVEASLDWLPVNLPELGPLAPVAGRLLASGSLADLQVDVALQGETLWKGQGEVRLLQPGSPFDAVLNGDWPGALSLAALPGVPADAPALQLQAPFTLAASGDRGGQALRLAMGASGLGYEDARLEAEGRWDGTTLDVDRAVLIHGDDRLQAAGSLTGATTARELQGTGTPAQATVSDELQGTGTPTLAPPLRASWSLATAGFDLPALSPRAEGRIAGQVLGEVSFGQDWVVTLETVDLTGRVGGYPARMAGNVSLGGESILERGELEGELFGASLRLTDRQLEASVPDLSRWHDAAAGRLELQVRLMPSDRRLAVRGAGAGLQWQALAVDSVGGSVMLAPGSPLPEQLDLELGGLRWNDLRIVSLKVSGEGDQSQQQLRVESAGTVAGVLALTAKRVESGWQGELSAAELGTPLGYWRTPEPIELNWSNTSAALQLAPHCWYSGTTQLCAGQASLGDSGQVALTLDGPLDFLAGLLPAQLGLEATAQASLQAHWAAGSAPRAELSVSLPAGSVLRVLEEGDRLQLSWDSIEGRVAFDSQGFAGSLEAEFLDGRAASEWTLPAARDGKASGALALDGLRLGGLAALAPELDELAGRLDGRVSLSGSAGAPQLRGAIALRDGRLRVAGNPTQLEGLELRLDLSEESARLEGDGVLGGGPVHIEGRLVGDSLPGPASGGPLELRLAVTGEGHQLLVPPSLEMHLSPRLDVVATPGLVNVTGDVAVRSGVLELEQLPEGSVALSNDVVLVDMRGEVAKTRPPFDTGLDIAVRIRERFEVRGDLLTATLGGDLQLQQVPGKPLQLFGNLRTVGGEIRLFGQVLRLARGVIAFTGTPERPDLDLRAERDIRSEDVRVGVAVRGSLQEPQLEVYSSPAMSQTEAMSYLTRGRGLDSGASSDSSALAMSMGFSAINRSGLLSGLNRLPGVNSIELGTDTTEVGTTATVSGYLGERLYLSYGTGLYEPITVLTGRLYLQSRLWLEMVSALENSLDVYYSFDVD